MFLFGILDQALMYVKQLGVLLDLVFKNLLLYIQIFLLASLLLKKLAQLPPLDQGIPHPMVVFIQLLLSLVKHDLSFAFVFEANLLPE